ncbi:MAG: glycoside hydrolase family 125 protein [Tissierella sp.]|uniref:glycoside hydrolase family 125 protein n=1 Tax=Tissierella sp. TaxID=41274 RepID=UPI003F9DC217
MKDKIPTSVKKFMEKINKLATDQPDWLNLFNNSFLDTLQNTIKVLDDDTTFVLTGDIPAMWLRDSTAQVRPYLFLANESEEIRSIIKGLIERHFQMINIDPYANAFNKTDNDKGHQNDQTEMQPIIWERKYEIDSLAYSVQLAYLYYKETGDTSSFNENFHTGVDRILDVWEIEQNHENSSYTFKRDNTQENDTLTHNGFGPPVAYTGMTWSGFRPSDDRCIYNYLVPSNMFAVAVLGYLEEIYKKISKNEAKIKRIRKLRNEIKRGIEKYGITENKAGNKVYAYEVDGLGNASLMDDANVPNLISAPYLGYCDINDLVYQETRKTLLSDENPFYYTGEAASGVGSSHTPNDYIWHMSLAMKGLTSQNKEFKKEMLDRMVETDAGKNTLHEGFHKDRPEEYTREWFSWPNMLFVELMLEYYGFKLKGAEL